MPNSPNRLSQFWQELKRRKVIYVITVYASAAFVIIELINNLTEPLNLPPNLATIVIVILAVGFPLSIILSWLYDLTGRGVEKTKPLAEVKDEEKTSVTNAWKIATIVSFVVIIGLVTYNIAGGTKQLRAGDIQSLVILPFENFTGDDQLENMVSGMHSLLCSDIGRISGLRVISKTTSKLYKGSALSASEIAEELNADGVVEGSIMCLGDTVCMRFSLISTTGEEQQIWIGDYNEDKGQVLNLYNGITRRIAEEVRIELTPEEERLFAKSRTVDREAFDAYLRSQEYWGDFSLESFNKARDYLNSAIEKDPDWAPLYFGLANYWMWLVQWGHEMPSIALPIASENLNKALELDPDLPDAHHLIGWIAFVSEWDWAKAEKEFLKALAINPNDAQSRIYYAHLLCVLQRQEEAIPQAKLALDMDPLNPMVQILYSTAQLFINWCEADRTQIERLLADEPNNYGATLVLNYLSSYCQEYDTALMTEKILLQTVLGGQFDEDAWKEIETIFKEKGYHAAYEKIVPIYEDLYSPNTLPMELAIAYKKANQYDKVMEMVEKGYEIRDHTMPYIATSYAFEPLYDNPRFLVILEKMNLPLPKSN
jgi:TolB-like protein